MISIVMITKNEEEHLEACLKQLSWCDDIVLVDDFSEDETVNIARRFPVRVFQRAFDHFSNQRNFGIDQARHDWILSLDPDEEVNESLRTEILQAIKNKEFKGYYIPFKHHFFGKWLRYGGWYPSYLKRLFLKQAGRWESQVHEILNIQGAVGYLQSPIIHYSHKDIAMFIRKMNRYTDFEVIRQQQKGRKDNPWTMLLASAKTFLNRYIRMRGFLDGAHGFVVAVLLAQYVFIARAKNWEAGYKKSHQWEWHR